MGVLIAVVFLRVAEPSGGQLKVTSTGFASRSAR
jgi:hypothetical protein